MRAVCRSIFSLAMTAASSLSRAILFSLHGSHCPSVRRWWRCATASSLASLSCATCQAAARVGPLFVDSPEIAATLVSALAQKAGAATVAIDIPDINKPAVAMAERAGLKPSFEAARMYTGATLNIDYAGLYCVTSLELG
jgi:hypothetical protein